MDILLYQKTTLYHNSKLTNDPNKPEGREAMKTKTEAKPMKPFYMQLARIIGAYYRSIESKNTLWEEKHEATIRKMEKELPAVQVSIAVQIDLERSTGERIVLKTAYHHMNENGMYDGWTEHRIIITPSLQYNYNLKITAETETK